MTQKLLLNTYYFILVNFILTLIYGVIYKMYRIQAYFNLNILITFNII